MTKKLLMGNEAIAHAALEAGVGVVAGYPGTPSSEIVETVARQYARGAAHGVHVEWSTNEKVALELLFGASLAGKRGLFTCKQMGLNVASDALMSLNYVSVRAGLVLIVADDPGPISSQTEQDTRRFAAFAKVPVLDPASPEQAYHMVKAAFDLSERFHTPVIVRPTTRVDHASAFLDVQEETTARTPLLAPSASGTIASLANRESGADDDPGATGSFPSGFLRDPNRWVIFPRRAYEAHGEINDRLREIAGVFATNPAFSQFNPVKEVAAGEPPRQSSVRTHVRVETSNVPSAPTFGIVAGGISAAYAREALRMISERAREAGVRTPAYRFMQVGTPYPFPEKAVANFVSGLAEILVVEELDHVLEDEFVRYAGRTHATFNVHGKLTGEVRDRGENDVDDIVTRIERFLGLTGRLSLHRLRDEIRGGSHAAASAGVRLSMRGEAELPKRPPVLCAGCPHRGSFYAVKTALGDTPAVMCGDIGCYTLGNAAPLEAVDTCLCMGGGVTMAQGIAVADPGKKAIAYIGDSTFFASGMPGIANAAYNGHDITVMVLDNATTAMTGSQPHPGTGYTLMGTRNKPLSIEAVLNANGITHVYHANPFDRDQSVMAVRAALGYEGPSAVVFEGPCAQIAPIDPAPGVDREVCTGCKRCITSIGCPAISFNANVKGPRSRDRGQAVVDTSLCVGCNLCVQTCPFKAIVPNLGAVASAPASATVAPPTTLASGPKFKSVAAAADQGLASGDAVDNLAPADASVETYGAADAADALEPGLEAVDVAVSAEPAGADEIAPADNAPALAADADEVADPVPADSASAEPAFDIKPVPLPVAVEEPAATDDRREPAGSNEADAADAAHEVDEADDIGATGVMPAIGEAAGTPRAGGKSKRASGRKGLASALRAMRRDPDPEPRSARTVVLDDVAASAETIAFDDPTVHAEPASKADPYVAKTIAFDDPAPQNDPVPYSEPAGATRLAGHVIDEPEPVAFDPAYDEPAPAGREPEPPYEPRDAYGAYDEPAYGANDEPAPDAYAPAEPEPADPLAYEPVSAVPLEGGARIESVPVAEPEELVLDLEFDSGPEPGSAADSGPLAYDGSPDGAYPSDEELWADLDARIEEGDSND